MDRTPQGEQLELLTEKLDSLQAKRAALLHKLDKLDSRIYAKQKEIARHSPIAGLSDDIGVEILKMAFQHDFPYCRCDSGLSIDSPIPISQVNRWWRRLALSTPRLWTCIHITPGQPYSVSFVSIIALYIERSNELPISISVYCHTKDVGDDAHFRYLYHWDESLLVWPRYEQTLRYLLHYHTRWKNLVIYSPWRELIDGLLDHIDGMDFPSLEYFGMFGQDDLPCDGFKMNFTAPRLHHFRSHSVKWLRGWDSLNPTLFGNLTQVLLSRVSAPPQAFSMFLSSIASSINILILSRVSLPYSRRAEDEYNVDNPLRFPRLRSLFVLNHVNPSLVCYILRGAPGLKSLHVSGLCTILPYISPRKESFSSIRRLEVVDLVEQTWSPHGASIIAAKISVQISRAFPGLDTLWFQGCGHIEAMLHEATELGDAGEVYYFPALRRITVPEDAHDALEAFGEWRATHGAPLSDAAIIVPRICARSYTSPSIREVTTRVVVSTDFWDESMDKPLIAPWDGEWDTYDQFEGSRWRVPEDSMHDDLR